MLEALHSEGCVYIILISERLFYNEYIQPFGKPRRAFFYNYTKTGIDETDKQKNMHGQGHWHSWQSVRRHIDGMD